MFELPVTLIGGYLGSGKTTYINHRLKHAGGVRYVVLVNDFGELNIDEQLIESRDGQTIALTNGCACCSISDDLANAFEEVERVSDQADWVLLEASGVANLIRLKSQLQNLPGFDLRNTLTLVDATRIRALVRDKYVGRHVSVQLKQADHIQLSRLDLISDVEQAELEVWLAQFEVSVSDDSKPDFVADLPRLDDVDDLGRLNHWLAGQSPEVRRIKGFVELKGEASPGYLVQWVEGEWSVTPSSVVPERTGLVRISSTSSSSKK